MKRDCRIAWDCEEAEEDQFDDVSLCKEGV
jgi:hypothetical protein